MVFAPHNYAESIDGSTIETSSPTSPRPPSEYGTTFWIGEYGWFGDPAETPRRSRATPPPRTSSRLGGTWWQWKQACGDPHSIGSAGGTPAASRTHRNGCPGDEDKGPIAEWACVFRPYPRAASRSTSSGCTAIVATRSTSTGTPMSSGDDRCVVPRSRHRATDGHGHRA